MLCINQDTCIKRMYILYIIRILFVINSFFDMDPRWKHPFTAIVAGSTGCGKTVFGLKLLTLASEMITPVPEKIIWCFGVYQDEFDKYPDIDFREGLPNPNTFDGTTKTMLVIDYSVSETDESVTEIFTKISHHRSVSVLYLSRNLFSVESTIER